MTQPKRKLLTAVSALLPTLAMGTFLLSSAAPVKAQGSQYCYYAGGSYSIGAIVTVCQSPLICITCVQGNRGPYWQRGSC